MTVPLWEVRIEPCVHVVQYSQRGAGRIGSHHGEQVEVAAPRGEVTQTHDPCRARLKRSSPKTSASSAARRASTSAGSAIERR